MRSYEAARGYFSFLGVVSWVGIVGGGLLALSSLASSAATMLAGISAGAILMCFGFFGLVFVQSSRAAVDSAEYSQQSLQVSRDQLEVSRQLLKLAEARDAAPGYAEATKTSELQNISFDTNEPANSTPAQDENFIEYQDYKIIKQGGRFIVNDQSFISQMEAMLAVDRLREKQALPAT